MATDDRFTGPLAAGFDPVLRALEGDRAAALAALLRRPDDALPVPPATDRAT
jgi:hypothetical protein